MAAKQETRAERAAKWTALFALEALTSRPQYLIDAANRLRSEFVDDPVKDRGSLGLVDGGADPAPQLQSVALFKLRHETLLRRVVTSATAIDVIEDFAIGDTDGFITLEDLPRYDRSAVEVLHGVGPKTMAQLDAALIERGLSWASGNPVRVAG
jgi:hypothetical protein